MLVNLGIEDIFWLIKTQAESIASTAAMAAPTGNKADALVSRTNELLALVRQLQSEGTAG